MSKKELDAPFSASLVSAFVVNEGEGVVTPVVVDALVMTVWHAVWRVQGPAGERSCPAQWLLRLPRGVFLPSIKVRS